MERTPRDISPNKTYECPKIAIIIEITPTSPERDKNEY
jgi:hypothetical protein